MTQPDNPVPARGARPQLFGETKATPSKAGKSRQPDFGPSILATIDGSPRRESRTRDVVSIKRVLWMSALALGAVAVYFGVKFGMMPSNAPMQLAVVQPQPVASPAVAERAAAPLVATASAVPAVGAGVASIENVAPPAPPAALPASAAEPVPASTNVTASLNNIQQALAQSEVKAEPPRKADKPAAPKPSVVAKPAAPVRRAAAQAKTATTKPGSDGDADLLAAMLPHIKRRAGPGPTSPDFEKRCGQFAGDAATECRVRFCTGREGVDAACPSAAAAR